MSGTWTITLPKWQWFVVLVCGVLMWLAVVIDVLGWLL